MNIVALIKKQINYIKHAQETELLIILKHVQQLEHKLKQHEDRWNVALKSLSDAERLSWNDAYPELIVDDSISLAKTDFSCTDDEMRKWWAFIQFGSSKIETMPALVQQFMNECNKVNVNWLVLWCQFCLETGFAKSQLYQTKLNMFGLAAIDSDPLGHGVAFTDTQTAIRAGAQHLAVYRGSAEVEHFKQHDFVLMRTYDLKNWGYFGIVKTLDQMGGTADGGKIKWASDKLYGVKLTKLYNSIVTFVTNK